MSVNLLRVNQAARELGISESWLRRAEQRGHIPKARRDVNGWRFYTEEDVVILRKLLFPGVSHEVSAPRDNSLSSGRFPGE